MEEQNTIVQEKKRPVFLTVISIVSFVMLGGYILSYIWDVIKMLTYYFDFTWLANTSIGFIATLLALFGVLKMWKLKKSGFILYIIAGGVSILSSIIFTIYYQLDYFDFIYLLSSIFSVHNFLTIGFIVMFGLNLKHME